MPEIQASARNKGALKLSNILQVDKFGEDLAMAKTRLNKPPSAENRAPEPKPVPVEKRAKLPFGDIEKAIEKGGQ
jgi:hypothetical protein